MLLLFSNNQIKEIRRAFIDAISALYDDREAENIFYFISEHFLNIDKSDFLLDQTRTVSESEILHFEKSAIKLNQHVPIQYIIGESMFYGCRILVDERVLIPRPETEELVDLVVKENRNAPFVKILDIGTGSGCLPIAIAKHVEPTICHAIEISEDALALARLNAEKNNVEVEFFQDNILDPKNSYSIYDIIVSNPPYIEESRKEDLEKRVAESEPDIALFVPDEDPVIFYKAIKDFCEIHLRVGGKLYLEINEAFPVETKALFFGREWEALLVQDIEGRDRFIKATKLFPRII